MRLTAEQIKQGIVHPNPLVRDMAVRYFCDSFSPDPAIMPLAVQAIQTHGWDQAFLSFWDIGNLVQTEEIFLWFIDQLNRLGRPKARKDVRLAEQLSRVVCEADVALLMKHEAGIMGIEGLAPKARDAIAERLRLLTIDTAACWQELEAFCEEIKAVRSIDKANIPHAERLVEAIARDGEAYADRILAILPQTQENYENNPMAWMECFVARLAGELRLDAAVPLLAAKLRDDGGDLLNEECQRAFTKVGTDATVETLSRDWSSAPWHYKLYAAGSLENIHSDLVVSRCMALYRQEADADIRSNLLLAVLNNFSSEGVEPARKMVLRGDREVRRGLVAAATLMDVSFPELKTWLHKEQEVAKRIKEEFSQEMEEMPAPPAAGSKPPPSFDHLIQPPPQPPLAAKDKIGRNDPCPCGSGKKFKKCCMGKE